MIPVLKITTVHVHMYALTSHTPYTSLASARHCQKISEKKSWRPQYVHNDRFQMAENVLQRKKWSTKCILYSMYFVLQWCMIFWARLGDVSTSALHLTAPQPTTVEADNEGQALVICSALLWEHPLFSAVHLCQDQYLTYAWPRLADLVLPTSGELG